MKIFNQIALIFQKKVRKNCKWLSKLQPWCWHINKMSFLSQSISILDSGLKWESLFLSSFQNQSTEHISMVFRKMQNEETYFFLIKNVVSFLRMDADLWTTWSMGFWFNKPRKMAPSPLCCPHPPANSRYFWAETSPGWWSLPALTRIPTRTLVCLGDMISSGASRSTFEFWIKHCS